MVGGNLWCKSRTELGEGKEGSGGEGRGRYLFRRRAPAAAANPPSRVSNGTGEKEEDSEGGLTRSGSRLGWWQLEIGQIPQAFRGAALARALAAQLAERGR